MQVATPPATSALLPTALQGAAITTPIEVTVTATPPNIEQLLRLITISGTVATASDKGTLTLATALGNFSLSLAALPDTVKQQLVQQLENLSQSQKPITAIVQPGSPPTQATLLLPATANAPTLPSAPPTTLPNPTPQPLTLSVGTSLPAVVLPPDIIVPGSSAPANPPNLAQTTTQVNAPPATNSAIQNQAATPFIPSPVLSPPLTPGKEIVVRIDAVSLPSAPPPAPTTAAQIPATVIGNGTNGQLIVKADNATLYVRANVEAPVGTHLLVTVEAQKPAGTTILPPAAEQNFAALQEVLTALADANPQIAQQLFSTHIPQPTAQLAGPLLFFLSALKQGDAKSWLGNNAADVLSKSGKMELLAKLAHDFGKEPETLRDATVGEWKSYPVPLHYQGEFQTVKLYVHSDTQKKKSDDTGNSAPNQVRFLIDVRMSKFGPMQLDGLVRPKKLDMIVRSEAALPSGLPNDLRKTYLNTIEAFGFTGSLSFQTGKQSWLTPQKGMPQSAVI